MEEEVDLGRKRWIMGGDFNEILRQEDNQGGIRRLESSLYLLELL